MVDADHLKAQAFGRDHALCEIAVGSMEPSPSPLSGDWCGSPTPHSVFLDATGREYGWDDDYEWDLLYSLTETWESSYRDQYAVSLIETDLEERL